MRDILIDLVRQTKDLFEQVKITGTSKETKVQAVDKDKVLFLQATLNAKQPELEGEFGLSNLMVLDGWLNFPSYKTEDASFSVRREVKSGNETVTAFVFKDATGGGATYKTMSPNLVGEQATIQNIPWQVTVVPSKSKVAEFSQLSKMYSEVDNKSFSISTEDGDLIFHLGDDNSATHNAKLVFESGVTGTLTGGLTFDTVRFLNLMKIAGTNPVTINITNKGVLGVEIQAPTATYKYFLRARH